MANINQMHQGTTIVDPTKDPINKLTVPVGHSGVPTYEDLQMSQVQNTIQPASTAVIPSPHDSTRSTTLTQQI